MKCENLAGDVSARGSFGAKLVAHAVDRDVTVIPPTNSALPDMGLDSSRT